MQIASASAHFGPHSSPNRRTFAARSTVFRFFSCLALPATSNKARESLAKRTQDSLFAFRSVRG